MASTSRLCVSVIDGNIFVTNKGDRIRLARVSAPSMKTLEGQIAKELLESLIVGQFIAYDRVAIGAHGHAVAAVAEVSVNSKNVNDAMRAAGYGETSAEMATSPR